MFDKEERELIKLSERMRDIPKPDNLDSFIRKGIALGIKEKKRRKVGLFSNIAAALAMVAFLTSIRALPAFADYVSKVPGLEYLVKLINHDKGLSEAVENNFIQKVNASVTQEDLIFTIKDMILDSSKGIIFYSIESKGNHRFVNLKRMDFMDEKSERLKASVTWSSFINKDISVEKKLEGKVEINFGEETLIPDTLHIEVKLKEAETGDDPSDRYKELSSVWKFEIPVNKEGFQNMQRTYSLNKNVEIEGQRILFKEVTITPTRIAVVIEYDENNTKRIMSFDNMRLVNEKGESWATIANGVSGSKRDDNNEIKYFQSNYFTDPKELYITAEGIRAIDKDKSTVVVDIEKGELLKAPDNRLTLEIVDRTNSSLSLHFKLQADKILDSGFHYNPFKYIAKDAGGREYNISGSRTSVDSNNMQRVDITLNSTEGIKSPLYLVIEDYPQRLDGALKIRVK
jgi:hypothetical protein